MLHIFPIPHFMYTHRCKYWDPNI